MLFRSAKEVDINAILELRAFNYTWSKIAEILDISQATLYRRLEKAGVSTDNRTYLSDADLDDVIRSIKQDDPNDGEVLIKGYIVRMKIRVPHQALRQSIHRVDHENLSRHHAVLRRRIYSVPYPNSVWHIDGHHMMIRWRFVIHGSIDGFSHTITYLMCFDNNCAATVVDLFAGAVLQFSLLDCVRSDYGGENVGVWQYMISSHHQDFSTVITGSSVHNERVEQLWRDVHWCVASTFISVFRSLESEEKLDSINKVDLYCFHYVFLPHMNKCLSEFQDSWNHHALSSEGNKSPLQLSESR